MSLLGVYLCNRLNRVIPTNLLGYSLKKLPSVFFPPSWLLLLREKKKKCQRKNFKQCTAHSGQIHNLFPFISTEKTKLSVSNSLACHYSCEERAARGSKRTDVPGIQKKPKSCLSVNPGRFRCQSVITSPVLPLRMIKCFQWAGEEAQWAKCLLYNREGCKFVSQHPSYVLWNMSIAPVLGQAQVGGQPFSRLSGWV